MAPVDPGLLLLVTVCIYQSLLAHVGFFLHVLPVMLIAFLLGLIAYLVMIYNQEEYWSGLVKYFLEAMFSRYNFPLHPTNCQMN